MDNDRHGRESRDTAPEDSEPENVKDIGEPPFRLKEIELFDTTGRATFGRFRFMFNMPLSVVTEEEDPCSCVTIIPTWMDPSGSGRLALTARENVKAAELPGL